MTSYYVRQEPQFIRAYIRQLPNLGAAYTQRAESWHNRVKRITNRHTPIEVSVRFIRDEVDQMVLDYENRINSQRSSTPHLMDRVVFVDIGSKITHEAIKMLMKEWNEAEMWAHRILENKNTPP